MRVEHKLSPAVAAYTQQALEQLRQIRAQYLAALGQAKECEIAADGVRLALSQQLAIVQDSEGLPRPLAPYQLSADGTAMIGEIADPPAQVPDLPPARVNGATPEGAHA
jgi:hypothetical protein